MNSHPVALMVLFADGSPPTWTDKEVMIGIGKVLGVVVPVLVTVAIFVIRHFTREAKARARKAELVAQQLRQEVEHLKKRIGDLGIVDSNRKAELEAIRAQLQQSQEKTEDVATELTLVRTREEALTKRVAELQENLASTQTTVGVHQYDTEAERRRIQRALSTDGQTWTEKVLAKAPDFKRLEPTGRRMPVISVLNLKGGVGKTTITANLGSALDGMGYRVLMLDLDLQGSLTSLFMTDDRQEKLFKGKQLLGDFLAAAFDAEHPKLYEYTQPILSHNRSGLVPTTDQLAYAETNLTMRWLLRDSPKDPRFLLRKELQFKRITNAYDIVLLDCPPLINICCVNALAASDYVLVPILPSKQATARAPVLLQRLKDFRENINPHLNVLGIVANRTHRSELTIDEQNRLAGLRGQCKDIWGFEVPLLDTFLRQNVEVRMAEDEHRPLGSGDEMYGTFADLAHEVASRLPMFCRPSETVVAVKEGVS
jgi:cellulose biosynthesis protein BcsQ